MFLVLSHCRSQLYDETNDGNEDRSPILSVGVCKISYRDQHNVFLKTIRLFTVFNDSFSITEPI